MIKNATFVSVWDDGIEIKTSCKVNTETREVFDIEETYVDGLGIVNEECVIIDEMDYNAVSAEYANLYPEEMDDETYWHE